MTAIEGMNATLSLVPATLPAVDLRGPLHAIIADLRALAQCDLDFDLRTPATGEFTEVHARLATTVSNLNEVMQQMAGLAGTVSGLSKHIVQANADLTQRTGEQAARVTRARQRLSELAAAVAANAAQLAQAEALAVEADRRARDGRVAVAKVVGVMQTIGDNADQIGGIITTIDEIAVRTRTLSRDAAIAAARAGRQAGQRLCGGGRRSVRARPALAQRSREATLEIQTLIRASGAAIDNGRHLACAAEQAADDVTAASCAARDLLGEITRSAAAQQLALGAANESLADIDTETRANATLVDELQRTTGALLQQSGFLDDAVNVFKIDPEPLSTRRHRLVYELAAGAARAVQQIFEDAVRKRRVTIDDLYDEAYQAIAGTHPPKFHTRFDGLTDELLPPIQERMLQEHGFLVYAGAVDRNGYFPTHNRCFTQPLTGDVQRDLAGNCTKRLFTDRVGSTCGSHTAPFKLQAYRCSNGELMFDLSVPINACGRHWGGFRVGYRA